MSMKDHFNGYPAKKDNDNVLSVRYDASNGNTVIMVYDFMARVMLLRTGESTGGLNAIPFRDLDRDTLTAMRDRLVELGGNPPELPAETPANPGAKPRGLNP